MLLFTVPPVAIVVFYNNPGQSTFTEAAWILAAYFALAWLLLIAVVVRPATISLLLLLAVIAISVVTEAPLAIWLETVLHSGTSNIVTSIVTVGLPGEQPLPSAHKHAGAIEEAVREQCPGLADVIVHTEPAG